MENQTNEVVAQGVSTWDARQTLVDILSPQLADVELNDASKEKVLDYLIQAKIFKLNTVKDLGQFVHYQTNEDQALPYRALLLNNYLLYVDEFTETVRPHFAAYQTHLENEDLYSEDYSYEQFISETDLPESEETTTTHYSVRSYDFGRIFMSMYKEKKSIENRLDFLNVTLEPIKEIVKDNYLHDFQL